MSFVERFSLAIPPSPKSIFASCLSLAALGFLPLPAMAETWETEIFGRAQYDYTGSEGDQSGFAHDRGRIRTARLGLDLKRGGTKVRLEVARNPSGEAELTDAYVKQALGHSGWSLRAGQFKTRNSLDEQTSGRFTSFFERAAFTDAFAFDRRAGVQLESNGKRHSVYAGLFAGNVNDTTFSGTHAAAFRYVFTPVLTETELLHLGVSLRWREADDQGFRYSQRPFSRDTDPILSTPRFAREDLFAGIEAATIRGPAWLAAEAGVMEAGHGPAGEAVFTGGYLEAGYVLGGHRTYEHSKFDRPKVYRPVTEGGPGALVLAVRADWLDMTDSPADGGRMDTIALAADWYATSHIHAGINLYRIEADFGASPAGLSPDFAAYVLNDGRSEAVTGLGVRFQIDF
jgi:phosphate-selective porin OprO/OprP